MGRLDAYKRTVVTKAEEAREKQSLADNGGLKLTDTETHGRHDLKVATVKDALYIKQKNFYGKHGARFVGRNHWHFDTAQERLRAESAKKAQEKTNKIKGSSLKRFEQAIGSANGGSLNMDKYMAKLSEDAS